MAMVVVGVLAGIVVTALGGYTLYKIFTRLQRDTETRRLQQQQGAVGEEVECEEEESSVPEDSNTHTSNNVRRRTNSPTTKEGGAIKRGTKKDPKPLPATPTSQNTPTKRKIPVGGMQVFSPLPNIMATTQITSSSSSSILSGSSSPPKKSSPGLKDPNSSPSNKREHVASPAPLPSATPTGLNITPNAVRVLPMGSPPTKRMRESSDGTNRQRDVALDNVGSGKENNAPKALSNGFHSNGTLPTSGNLEMPISFDQPIRTPGLKVTTRIRGPNNRRPPTRHAS